MRTSLVLALLLVATACKKVPSKLDDNPGAPPPAGGSGSSTSTSTSTTADNSIADIDSKDILARSDTSPSVYVKHVLIGWKEIAHDPRAQQRTNAQAAQLAKDVLAKLQANPGQIDDLAKQYSEDPGSAASGEPYHVTPDAGLVPEFKNLALRLKDNEAGIVRTRFGYHVMLRVAPPKPDPLESTAILARTPEAGPVFIQYMIVGWAGTGQPMPGVTRSKADADKIAKDVVDQANAGGDFDKLMADHSDIPNPDKKKEPAMEIEASARLPDELKDLPLRLKVNEVGMVKSEVGWLIIKRVAPPPPDPLESSDILARKPVADKVKVKHILLGWSELHPPGDAAGEKRTRADLEKLVKDTVAKLKKGDKIEPLMASLSADKGSATSGKSYDVTADAQLVPSFKNLSLRLNLHEVGVVKSEYGIHIIQRVE